MFMYSEIFTGLFQSFIDKNPFLLVNSYNANYINIDEKITIDVEVTIP